MIKCISWLRPASIAIGLVSLLFAIAEAGTYNLEYPANYGCKCTPNWQNYGNFKTQWRQWPGEPRMDVTHSRAVGAEPLPPTRGIEQLPPPRVKLHDLQKGPPPVVPEGGSNGPVELPGGPTTPGGGANLPPGLPPDNGGGANLPQNLPFEPGGLKPTPFLPPDLQPSTPKQPFDIPGLPSPTEKKEDTPSTTPQKDTKDEKTPGVGGMQYKPEPTKKQSSNHVSTRNGDVSGSRPYVPVRLPETASVKTAVESAPVAMESHPQANWNSALDPGTYSESSRSGAIYPSTDIVRQTDYQVPSSSGKGAPSNEIVQQSYQQPQSVDRYSSFEAPANLRQTVPPPLALKGYCPVELCVKGRWVQGDARWTATHKGIVYHFSGNEQRTLFLANPEQFVPANGGDDPVILASERRSVPGELNYCAAFKGRIYMFQSAATQAEFQKSPERFVGNAPSEYRGN